jgi:hypothetical protein
MVGVGQGRGIEALAFLVLPLPARSDMCNVHRGYLENPMPFSLHENSILNLNEKSK